MNDGILVEVIDSGHKTILEFLFGRDADVAEHRAGHFGEEALDQIEPGAVLGREGNSKRCAGRSASQALVSREMCAE